MLSLTLCTDILAICCIKKHVCIGIGSSVHVYCIATRELVAKLSLLGNDNVHNIVQGTGNKLIVYGGKSLRICELEFVGDIVHFKPCSAVQQFSDWIIATRFSQEKDNEWLSILFAHNNLRLYNAAKKLTHSVWCQEKCILYGGSLLPKNNEETVIFSGTVFQEILIWQVKNGQKYTEDVPILHRLKGHKGVIFSVVYDPILGMISSTSDDRTIRLWRVRNKTESNSAELDWCNSEVDLTTTMYGHTARVWKSVIKNNRILSVGEDSLMCTWSFGGELLNKTEAHHGAEIWSIDVSEDNETIFTGGADGAVNVWHFEATDPPLVKTVLGNNSFPAIPKYVCYMNSGMIVVFVDGGTLVTYDTNLKETQRLSISARYKSYCIMEISPDRKKIALGSKDGWAEIYEEYADSDVWQLRKILAENVMESMILSLHWPDNKTILVCGKAGLLNIVDILCETKKHQRSEFILPPSRERWTTTAIIEKNLLICGDRAGSVYVFDLDQEDAGPAQIFPKIHGRLGVQSFSIVGNKVLSTGRDGTLRYYENLKNEEKQHLQALHLHKMPMDWVCKILPYDGDVLVLGFIEVEFVIYSMNFKRLILRFVCGGGHRSWDCRVLGNLTKFVYIKDKQVYEIDAPLRNISKPIRNGFHTKEIYCIQPILTSSKHNIFVSAGEDSTLRLNVIAHTKQQMETSLTTLSTYDGHISNVKCIAVLNTENSENHTKNLVFTGGGRAQLKVWEIRIKVDETTLQSQNVTCRKLLSYMLCGTDKDRKKTAPSVKTGFFADPETRFMDINAQIYHQDPNFVLLFIACSDGLLRIFVYDIVNNILRLSRVVNCGNRCILKVHSFVHENCTILLSMTTDGIISFWQMKANIESLDIESEHSTFPFTKMKIHQSGINSFDFQKIGDSQYLLLTGGDDNLISLVMFEISSTEDELLVHTLSKWESSSIHSAQITGAKFVGSNRMLTTGIDQRVVIHSYSFVDGILSVSQIDEITTFVPDVQGVTLCRPTQTNADTLSCIYGKGLELILLNQENIRH